VTVKRNAMNKIRLAVAMVLMLPVSTYAAENDLHGTYRLVSSTHTLVDTGQVETFTAEKGFITYGADGRMSVLIVRGDRPKPASLEKITDQQRADLLRSMIAYAGTYKFDGKTVEHHVDISWNEVYTGTIQRREVRREGDKLLLSTPASPRPQDGKMTVRSLVWEKVK
jgi:hypothetical protein